MRRDEQVVEAELMEISAIQDDMVKLERIVAWCAAYPDEIPFALSFFKARSDAKRSSSLHSTSDLDRS
ncbi:MAG TPA: hypothetical protein VK604_01935 [Bryobacteraceae bacterium]|nr:hypothetical protein [Bryobacteraceae bacterium]HTF66545.1 hypothetical protein [Edaphobacter sp.]